MVIPDSRGEQRSLLMGRCLQAWQPGKLAILYVSLLLLWMTSCGRAAPNALPQDVPAVVSTATPEAATIEMITPQSQTAATMTPDAAGGFDCAAVSQIPPAECLALVALYNSTNGSNWVDNSGWLNSDKPCSWSGINCTDGHVDQIHLLYNELSGTLPPELGGLSELQVLGLWVNQLQGPIPPELGRLSRLEYLDLMGNQLSGPLPDALGDLANLRTLHLVNNQFSGSIPAALGNLASLESLDLSHNQLSGFIPADLGDLTNLAQLRLSHNQFSGTIPETFSNLRQLNELDLSYNQLSGSIPQAVGEIAQRTLWGNQFEGTFGAGGQEPINVAYEGIHFTADPSLAASIWPERIPAVPVPEGEPIWYAAPEHLRFTFADPNLQPGRSRMGINLAAEAQILVYPLADLAQMDPLVQERIEQLHGLLAERGPVPSGELPLLPVTNAAQMFHAQAQYLDSGKLLGLRFISQHSQEVFPIINQNIFYTFQGLTADGLYYVVAFFPLNTAVLPDTVEVEDWETFSANYAAYVAETTAVLDQLSPADFTPDLSLLDAVIASLSVDPSGLLLGTEQASGSLPSIAPPAGLVYKTPDGLWRVTENGEPQLLSARAEALPAPDAAHAVYLNEERQLRLIDLADGSERSLASGADLSGHFQWGDAQTLLLGVWLAAAEGEGISTGHMATLDISTGELTVIDEERLSLGRPDLAPDGLTVAYDISPFYTDVTHSGYIYHPDSGAQPFDPTRFRGFGEDKPLHLYNPAWAPSGAQLSWLSGAEARTRLVIFDLARQAATTTLIWQPAQFGALPPTPVWSPEGNWVAVDVWADNEQESGLWLLASDRSYARRISTANSSSMVGQGPVWLSAHELAYIECDENYSNCENWLFDLAAEKKVLLDLPPGSIVLLAPHPETAEG